MKHFNPHLCFHLLLILSILPLKELHSQNIKSSCGTDKAMKELFEKNKNAKNELNSLRLKISSENQAQKTSSPSYVIPVVFHVFGKNYNSGTVVTQEIIEDALKKTNEDFQGLNSDYNTIDAPFDVIKKPLDITFKLAKIDPNGNPTSGVIFYDKASGMGNYNSPEVKNVAWDNYKYCNIYITRDLYGNGDFYNSGIAWYPNKTMSDLNIARIVYNGSYLGNNTNENFRSVLTHEFGHYLDLPHTFYGAVCSTDPKAGDGIADTPSHKNNSSGTGCQVIKNCLNQEINNENFMDYTDCYKMFTQGQVNRMINALENSPTRNTLWTEKNLIATGVNANLGPRLITSTSQVKERYLNDGVLETSIEVSCEECTFTKSSGTMNLATDYTVQNLPEGITTKVDIINNTKAIINFNGTATNHSASNSINNLAFKFNSSIITGGSSILYKDSIENISIKFNEPYTEFCNINIRYRTYTHITNVSFNENSNTTRYDGISNYAPTVKFKVKKNKTYPLSITTNKGAGGANDNLRIQVWADWNSNFVYEDNELIISHPYKNTQTDNNGNYTYNTSIQIPSSVKMGNTAFRVLAHYVQSNEGDSACSTIDSGESEDYGLSIVPENTPFEVDFFGHPTTVNLSEEAQFNDFSIAANGDSLKSWKWTFEGGSPANSTEKNPTNILFPIEGTYDVTLEVTSTNGLKKTIKKSDYITSRLKYCKSYPNYGTYFSVNKVNFNTINHEPGKSNYYNYYNTISTDLETGKTYPITIKSEKGNGGDSDVNKVKVWADWNYDGQFTQDELLINKEVKSNNYDQNGEYSFTSNITVPNNAAVGKKIGLRITGHFVDGKGETSCGAYDSGNTVDYSILIKKGNGNTTSSIVLISDDTKEEGAELQHLVTLDNTTVEETKIALSINNATAINGTDFNNPTFTNGVTYNQGEITIPSGVKTFTIKVPTIDDSIVESSENYNITANSITATGTITDNDSSSSNYCNASNLRNDSYITNVTFGSINNSSGYNSYSNYSNISNTFASGQTFNLKITTKNDHWTYNAIGTWIDWNNDGEFSDNERVYKAYKAGPYATDITVPNNAVKNTSLRMRIRYAYGSESKITPCGEDTYFGEVEDYSIKISAHCYASTLRNDSFITNVSFGAINNSTGFNSYLNYENLSHTISPQESFNLKITTKNDHWTYNAIGVWIDWNNDGNFSNSERVYKAFKAGPYSANISAPNNTVKNTPLKMRVRYAYGAEYKITPCGEDTYFGEVEDYTILVENNSVARTDTTNLIENLKLYPNPSDSFIFLKFETNKNVQYELTNIQGKIIMKADKTPNQNQIKISVKDLPVGIYFIRGQQENKIFQKKFFVK